MTTTQPETTTTPASVIEFVQPWLTGNNEADAQRLARKFRMIGLSIGEWRKVVADASRKA
jgi:hypothetical protein